MFNFMRMIRLAITSDEMEGLFTKVLEILKWKVSLEGSWIIEMEGRIMCFYRFGRAPLK